MSDRDLRMIRFSGTDMPFEAMTDLYRAKYGFPLDGESHERFIATKVPYRKNKDNRPRFRNASFGYPTFKKDNYTRHWYNLIDIFNSNDAPAIKYGKFFAKTWVVGFVFNAVGSAKHILFPTSNALDQHKRTTSSNYVKETIIGGGARTVFLNTKGPATTFALFSTFYFFVHNKFKDYDYSRAQSLLRASAIVAPMIVFYHYDRPFANFWYRSLTVGAIIYTFLYTYIVQKNWKLTGTPSINSEKFYLKSVSPQEIAKIEYEDHIQRYGKMFDLINMTNYYDYVNNQHNDNSFLYGK